MKLYNTNQSKSTNTNNDSSLDSPQSNSVNVDELVGVELLSSDDLNEEDDSLLSEIDFQESRKTSKRQSLAISKIIIIVGGTGVFALFAYLMFGGFKGVNQSVKKVVPNQVQEQEEDPLSQLKQQSQQREAELRTEIALGTQQKQLSEERKRTTRVAETVEIPDQKVNSDNKESSQESLQKPLPSSKPTPQSQSTSSTANTTSRVNTTSRANTTSRRQQSSRVPSPQRPTYVKPTLPSLPPPQKTPAPLPVRPTLPVVQKTPAPPPPQPAPPPLPVKPTLPQNPQLHIAKAMSYGNYGQMDYSSVDLSPIPQPQEVIAQNQNIEANKQVIAPGQIVEGILNTPIFWAGDLRLESQPQRFAIDLLQPLYDSEGEVMISENSILIAKLKETSQSGIVFLEVLGAVSPQREQIKFSPNTLSITSYTGSPLIAQSQRQRGNRQNLRLSIMSGLSKVGELLNRADSSTTYSGFGGFSTRTQNNNDPNILGGILEGAFGEMRRQAAKFDEKHLEQILDRPFIWAIQSGEKVKIFVNNSDW